MAGKRVESLREQLDRERRQVDVDHFDLTVGEIVRLSENNELIRAPAYQRKFRWSTEDESLFIESIFLGFPVPRSLSENPLTGMIESIS
jgi:uncharacterized protein with ParB-like and HNH nuclease domain